MGWLPVGSQEAEGFEKRDKSSMVGGGEPEVLKVLIRELARSLTLSNLSKELAELRRCLDGDIPKSHSTIPSAGSC
jgi:hypothetical protein